MLDRDSKWGSKNTAFLMLFFLKIDAFTSIPQSQPAEMELLGFSKPQKCCLLQVYNIL